MKGKQIEHLPRWKWISQTTVYFLFIFKNLFSNLAFFNLSIKAVFYHTATTQPAGNIRNIRLSPTRKYKPKMSYRGAL
jgi:hypothetical protein